jgi:hypothetical protein
LFVPKLSASFYADSDLLRGVLKIIIEGGRVKYSLFGDVAVVKGEEHFKIVRASVDFDVDHLSLDITGLENSELSKFGGFWRI